MALDIGMGNPLALAKTGIDAVKGIYEAYKVRSYLAVAEPSDASCSVD